MDTTRRDGGDTLRDDEAIERSQRPGHYSLREYRAIAIAQPLAGVDVVATVPQGSRWRVQCLQAQLVSSAAIANRVAHLVITDGQGNTVYNFPAQGNQLAGTTGIYTAGSGVVAVAFDGVTVMVVPENTLLLRNWTIGFKTSLLDGADQWSKLALIVEEWLEF